MHCEIITIGNELTSGRVLDSNSWYAAGRLIASGLRVSRMISVGDDYAMVADALTTALTTSRFVIVTGGLGSTDDDITNEIVAKALDRPLHCNRELFERIKRYVETRGLKMTPSFEKMAWLPDGAAMINPEGDACGFSLVENGVRFFFLPGVPDQMRYLMDKFVLPEIVGRCNTLPVMRQRILKLFGVDEAHIAEVVKTLEGTRGDVVFGFYPTFPEHHITLSHRGEDEASVTAELDRMEHEVRALFGAYVFASGTDDMERVVGRRLVEGSMTVAVAESCTGGLIGHRLTNVPGSSVYFKGGAVVYGNEAKADLLGVRPDTLDRFGAVSDGTAREMARGVRARFHSDLGLAVTGIAGPDGGSPDKPVGTVHVGFAVEREVWARKYRFWGNRAQVKSATSTMALDWVRRYLNGYSFLPGV